MKLVKIIFFVILYVLTSKIDGVLSLTKEEMLYQTKLPPCKACKSLIDSFKKGMEKTAKGKFEGGDTAWEEEKLGSYAQSEVRLVEIQEKLCQDITEGRDQCYALHEQHDDVIEDWWFNFQSTDPDLYKYFCIEKHQVCCPDLHFGPKCTPCPGYPDNVCGRNGKCRGSGTRKGKGECKCDPAYNGTNCDICADMHYEVYKDDQKLLCSKCHISCDSACTASGSTGCVQCADGWIMEKEKGCLDVNECATAKSVCSASQFCVNSEGSFRCLNCDRSCLGCTGDGPDMCIDCANDYILVDNMCVDSEQESRKQHMFLTRYLTYIGLCVATCIIFQRNVILAAIIGLAVGIYISVSEYMLSRPPTPNAVDFGGVFEQEI